MAGINIRMGEKHTGMKRRHNLILNGGEGCVRVHSSVETHRISVLSRERSRKAVVLQLPNSLSGGTLHRTVPRGITPPGQKRARRTIGVQCDLLSAEHVSNEYGQLVKQASRGNTSKKQNEQLEQESEPDIFNAAMMLDLDDDLGSLFDEYVESSSSNNNDSVQSNLFRQQRLEFIPETVPDTVTHDGIHQHQQGPPPQLEGYALPDVDAKDVRSHT